MPHTANPLPPWTSLGLIPPIRPGEEGHSTDRSPYRVDLSTLIERFCTTLPRAEILTGYMEYRAELHKLGLTGGIQWIDGSFTENKEGRLGEVPNDVDVVTFTEIPSGKTQTSLLNEKKEVFISALAKTNYKVDAYFQFLGEPSTSSFVRQLSYWNSMWSHTRDFEWKGFLEVDLSPADDAAAQILLEQTKDILSLL